MSEFHDGKITAQCNLCARANILKFVRSYGAVTSNLNAHFKVSKCPLNSMETYLNKFTHLFSESIHKNSQYTEHEKWNRQSFIIHQRKSKSFRRHPRKVGHNACVHLMNLEINLNDFLFHCRTDDFPIFFHQSSCDRR